MLENENAWNSFPVRICKVADRYLVFDPGAVALLRRYKCISGTLVGTTPQQPTQNTFMGLPLELRPEEAGTLVQENAAYIIDDKAAHLALQFLDPLSRQAYIESLRRQKQTAQRVLAERNSKRNSPAGGSFDRTSVRPSIASPSRDVLRYVQHSSPSDIDVSPDVCRVENKIWGITPVSSNALVARNSIAAPNSPNLNQGHVCRFLLSHGYFMTPGLRFGAQYSVYPGDPLRFHAHFMANQYPWHAEIPMLDIVSGGRLATAVKKALLIGGQQPLLHSQQDHCMRTFSIEWAIM